MPFFTRIYIPSFHFTCIHKRKVQGFTIISYFTFFDGFARFSGSFGHNLIVLGKLLSASLCVATLTRELMSGIS